MKTTSFRARAIACALLAGTAYCGLTAQPAAAQTAREHRALDSNGVDLTHGDFVLSFVEGSIGSGEAQLRWSAPGSRPRAAITAISGTA